MLMTVDAMFSSVELHSVELGVLGPQPDWSCASRQHLILAV
jgi:hypothetical protein